MSGQFPVEYPVTIEISAFLVPPPYNLPTPSLKVIARLVRPIDLHDRRYPAHWHFLAIEDATVETHDVVMSMHVNIVPHKGLFQQAAVEGQGILITTS